MEQKDADNLKARIEEQLPKGVHVAMVGPNELELAAIRQQVHEMCAMFDNSERIGLVLSEPAQALVERVAGLTPDIDAELVRRVIVSLGRDMYETHRAEHDRFHEALHAMQEAARAAKKMSDAEKAIKDLPIGDGESNG